VLLSLTLSLARAGNNSLNVHEFERLVSLQLRARKKNAPPHAPPPKNGRQAMPLPDREMIRDWFDSCDRDHDGAVSFTEFFAFSLREALARALDGRGVLRDFFSL
jgi:hypothetical protein